MEGATPLAALNFSLGFLSGPHCQVGGHSHVRIQNGVQLFDALQHDACDFNRRNLPGAHQPAEFENRKER